VLNRKKNYRITAINSGIERVNGLHLKLDHIQDPDLRPLDEFFTDHFKQCVFKHTRGPIYNELEDTDDYDADSEFKKVDLKELLKDRKLEDL